MNIKVFENKLESAQSAFDEQISNLAEEIRQEIIIPICREHKLEFMAGNGTFFFFNTKKTYAYLHDIEGTKLESILKPVINLLNREVTYNAYLGFFVNDVGKKDLK